MCTDGDRNSGVEQDELHEIHGERSSGDDNVPNVKGSDIEGVKILELRQGWCSNHKIKGDKIQKKVKKWTKKKFGYWWVTSTLVEYKCQLENSDHPTTDVVLSEASNCKAALTNRNGKNQSDYILWGLIGEKSSERTGLEDRNS